MIFRRRSYAIEERMSGDWIERWSGFTSFRAARAYLRRVDGVSHGKLRIVQVLRIPVLD